MSMEEKVLQILKEMHPENDYTESENFIGEELLDSYDMIELVSRIEETFDVSIDGLEIILDNFRSLERIVKTIQRNGGTLCAAPQNLFLTKHPM